MLGMIAVAPGAIASIMRLRRARKLSPLPLSAIAIHYATQAALTAIPLAALPLAWFRFFRRAAFLRVGIRRGRDEQRPPAGAAEHACKRIGLHLDSLGDLAALLHPNHLRHGRTRHPDCIFGVQANSVGRTRSQLGP